MNKLMFIRWLKDVSFQDKNVVGGKAAGLGEVIRLGMSVPIGFCVTTETYERCLLVKKPISEAAFRDSANSSFLTPSLSLVPDAALAVRRALLRLFALLRPGASVAVRSSAIAEDSPSASFAGQFVTFLGIKDKEEAVSRIEDCWASLWKPNVIAYQQRMNIPSPSMSMGVIIQRMVPAEIAGVLFTANPTTGDPHEFWVEAGWGLGDTIVSGTQTPETFLIKVGSETNVTEYESEEKKGLMSILSADERNPIKRSRIPPPLRRTRILKSAKLNKLVKTGQVITAHFGVPQDIEWAMHKGRLYILQSRPMTSLEKGHGSLL